MRALTPLPNLSNRKTTSYSTFKRFVRTLGGRRAKCRPSKVNRLNATFDDPNSGKQATVYDGMCDEVILFKQIRVSWSAGGEGEAGEIGVLFLVFCRMRALTWPNVASRSAPDRVLIPSNTLHVARVPLLDLYRLE